MAAYNMSNIHVSPNVLSTLMTLQKEILLKLQQQILHDISRSSRRRCTVEKPLLTVTQNSQENTRLGFSF